MIDDDPWELPQDQYAKLKKRLASSDPSILVPAKDVFARLREIC